MGLPPQSTWQRQSPNEGVAGRCTPLNLAASSFGSQGCVVDHHASSFGSGGVMHMCGILLTFERRLKVGDACAVSSQPSSVVSRKGSPHGTMVHLACRVCCGRQGVDQICPSGQTCGLPSVLGPCPSRAGETPQPTACWAVSPTARCNLCVNLCCKLTAGAEIVNLSWKLTVSRGTQQPG